MLSPIIPVILCGGSGTRLWPVSRNATPKQFLNLLGDHTLLQDTARRALNLTGTSAGDLMTVTLGSLAQDVKTQLEALEPDSVRHVIAEPSARNTAAAIAYAAIYARASFGEDAIVWILPSDHHMGNLDSLRTALTESIKAAQDDYLVTFGITPTRPETGYGYIKVGSKTERSDAHIIYRFVEKPDKATAQTYLDDGAYLWNSGMFLFKVRAVIDQFRRFAPAILDQAEKAMAASTDRRNPDAALYGAIEKVPFDIAIMEKADRRAVVPCNPEWSDIGSWESLWDIRKKDENGNSLDRNAVAINTTNSLVLGSGKRLITTVGLDHIAVVETGDAILVLDLRKSQDIKTLVETLQKSDHKHLLDHFVADK